MGVISLPGLPDDDDEPISPLSSSSTIITPGHTTCTAYIVIAYIRMAYIVMASIAMDHIVLAFCRRHRRSSLRAIRHVRVDACVGMCVDVLTACFSAVVKSLGHVSICRRHEGHASIERHRHDQLPHGGRTRCTKPRHATQEVQCGAALCSAACCMVAQHSSAARHNTAWHGTAQHGTAGHGTAQCSATRHGTTRHGTA